MLIFHCMIDILMILPLESGDTDISEESEGSIIDYSDSEDGTGQELRPPSRPHVCKHYFKIFVLN